MYNHLAILLLGQTTFQGESQSMYSFSADPEKIAFPALAGKCWEENKEFSANIPWKNPVRLCKSRSILFLSEFCDTFNCSYAKYLPEYIFKMKFMQTNLNR